MENLEYNGKIREDIRGVLKYTLQLHYIVPSSFESSAMIDSVLESLHTCCHNLMRGNKSSFDFFGINKNRYILSEEDPSCNVKSLENLLFYDCIIHCYHILLEYYTSDMVITPYALDKKIKSFGFNELVKKGTIVYESNTTPIINNYVSSQKGDPSNFVRTYSLHANIMNKAWKMDPFPSLNVPFVYSSTAYTLKTLKAPTLKRIFDTSDVKPIETVNAISDVRKEICESIAKPKEEKKEVFYKADRLYKYYLNETCFNVDLEYVLISYLLHTEKKQLDLTDINSLKTICSCCKLQNVISRKPFLFYALNSIDQDIESYDDFWNAHLFETNKNSSSPFIAPKQPSGFYYDKWREQFDLFIGYFSKFLYPIYAWAFLSLFLDTIESVYDNLSHHEQIEKGLDILSQYMNDNYSKFTDIINADNVSPIFDNEVIINSDVVRNIHSIFIKKYPQKRRVPYVNRTLFVSRDMKHAVLHEDRNIHNFYINWIKYNKILTDNDDVYRCCNICGKYFNIIEAKNTFNLFHKHIGFDYNYFSKELCIDCASSVVENLKANYYTPICPKCHKPFDYFKDLLDHSGDYQRTLDDSVKSCYKCFIMGKESK